MKPFEIKRTIIDPYSAKDELAIENDMFIIQACVDNICCDSFATLELIEVNSVFNDISHIEIEFDDDNILNINRDEFSAELHVPINRIELKDMGNQTIFKINVCYEEGSHRQIVHLKIIPK